MLNWYYPIPDSIIREYFINVLDVLRKKKRA